MFSRTSYYHAPPLPKGAAVDISDQLFNFLFINLLQLRKSIPESRNMAEEYDGAKAPRRATQRATRSALNDC